MKKEKLFVGLDVDDKNIHMGIFNPLTGEMSSIKCKPTLSSLLKKLKVLLKKGYELKVCYEASYIGYSLCRELLKKGIECEVIAPSLIPRKAGDRVKTERIDGEKLARYNANSLLTKVRVPDEEDEAVRSLTRSREFMVRERKRLKQHILSLCRQHNLNYKQEEGKLNYWTKSHIKWLESKIEGLNEYLRSSFEILLSSYENISMQIDKFEEKIEEASKEERYEKKVRALNSFRGLSTLSSMSLILEIGDIKRFVHPKKLVSYSGFDIREYSSGGKELKYGITKMGNIMIRRVLVESVQHCFKKEKISRRLSKAREGVEGKVINIADRCMKRLRDKYLKMLARGKERNKIKVACAREKLCFIWEVLNLVS